MAGLLNPAGESGLLGPGVENDPARGELGLFGMLKRLPQSVLETAMIPGRVFQGEAAPSVENAMALSGLMMGGRGLLGGAPPSSLGVFGGQMRSPSGPASIMRMNPNLGLISQKIRIPSSGAEGLVATKVRRGQVRDTVDLDLNFAIKDPATGASTVGRIGLPAKEGSKFFTAAMNEARRHVSLIRPGNVTFTAAHPRLIPVYKRIEKQIAKETGGTVTSSGVTGDLAFSIRLPNPRKFKAGEGAATNARFQADARKARAAAVRTRAREQQEQDIVLRAREVLARLNARE